MDEFEPKKRGRPRKTIPEPVPAPLEPLDPEEVRKAARLTADEIQILNDIIMGRGSFEGRKPMDAIQAIRTKHEFTADPTSVKGGGVTVVLSGLPETPAAEEKRLKATVDDLGDGVPVEEMS